MNDESRNNKSNYASRIFSSLTVTLVTCILLNAVILRFFLRLNPLLVSLPWKTITISTGNGPLSTDSKGTATELKAGIQHHWVPRYDWQQLGPRFCSTMNFCSMILDLVTT